LAASISKSQEKTSNGKTSQRKEKKGRKNRPLEASRCRKEEEGTGLFSTDISKLEGEKKKRSRKLRARGKEKGEGWHFSRQEKSSINGCMI